MKVFVDFGFAHPVIVRLKPYLADLGVDLVNYPYSNCEVHYSHVQYMIITPLPRPKVLRLDGCYYDGIQDNTPLEKSYEMSNHIIFQSEFSKRLCESIFKPSKEVPSTIIYNAGAYWNNPEPHEGFNIVCCARWRRWKRLKEIFQIWGQLPFGSTLHIVGEVLIDKTDAGKEIKEVRATLTTNKGIIEYYGDISHEKMEKLYRTMDVGLHIAKRDACPNSVVEFISSGIPVVVSDKGGGATELATMTPGCRIAAGDYDPNEIDIVKHNSDEWNAIPKEFEENVIEHLTELYKNRTRTHLPSQLRPECVAGQYAQVFREVIK
jgi:glycosyltransferase involved in cell wall biosynthesis